MDARHRMADIAKLRCNLCQDFLRMIISEGWQTTLYNKAKREVETKSRLKDKYIAAYEKMRDVGPENYSIDDMDVTFITEILTGWRHFAVLQNATVSALYQVKDDRNVSNHSGENEDEEELYLIGLLALCDMRNFVRAVDKETAIDDSARLSFRRKYTKAIDELKDTLDEERIALIQRVRDMDRDIRRVLDSDNPLGTWVDISALYMDRYCKVEKKHDLCMQFMVRASDAGVTFAHSQAASYYCLIKKDAIEAEKKLRLLFDEGDGPLHYKVQEIVGLINWLNATDSEKRTSTPEGIRKLIQEISSSGYEIIEDAQGVFHFDIDKYKKK